MTFNVAQVKNIFDILDNREKIYDELLSVESLTSKERKSIEKDKKKLQLQRQHIMLKIAQWSIVLKN